MFCVPALRGFGLDSSFGQIPHKACLFVAGYIQESCTAVGKALLARASKFVAALAHAPGRSLRLERAPIVQKVHAGDGGAIEADCCEQR